MVAGHGLVRVVGVLQIDGAAAVAAILGRRLAVAENRLVVSVRDRDLLAVDVRRVADVAVHHAAGHHVQGVATAGPAADPFFQTGPDLAVEVVVLGRHVGSVESLGVGVIAQAVGRRDLVSARPAAPEGAGDIGLAGSRHKRVEAPGVGAGAAGAQAAVKRISHPVGDQLGVIPVEGVVTARVTSDRHVVPEDVQAVVRPGLGQFHPALAGGGTSVDLGFGIVGGGVLVQGDREGLLLRLEPDVGLAGPLLLIGVIKQRDGPAVPPAFGRSDLDPVRIARDGPVPLGVHLQELAAFPAGNGITHENERRFGNHRLLLAGDKPQREDPEQDRAENSM